MASAASKASALLLGGGAGAVPAAVAAAAGVIAPPAPPPAPLSTAARAVDATIEVLTTGYWPAYPPIEVRALLSSLRCCGVCVCASRVAAAAMGAGARRHSTAVAAAAPRADPPPPPISPISPIPPIPPMSLARSLSLVLVLVLVLEVALPPELAAHCAHFGGYYAERYQGRRLAWQHALGHCIVKARFAKGRKELDVSLFQVLRRRAAPPLVALSSILACCVWLPPPHNTNPLRAQ